MTMERFSASLWLNLYQLTPWESSVSAYTPHPGERLGRILFPCSLYPDFYTGETCDPDENRPCPTEVLVWINGRLRPRNISWHTLKPKSRHRLRPTVPPPAPPPAQSLHLGEACLWSFKEEQPFYFPASTAQKQLILGEKLLISSVHRQPEV